MVIEGGRSVALISTTSAPLVLHAAPNLARRKARTRLIVDAPSSLHPLLRWQHAGRRPSRKTGDCHTTE